MTVICVCVTIEQHHDRKQFDNQHWWVWWARPTYWDFLCQIIWGRIWEANSHRNRESPWGRKIRCAQHQFTSNTSFIIYLRFHSLHFMSAQLRGPPSLERLVWQYIAMTQEPCTNVSVSWNLACAGFVFGCVWKGMQQRLSRCVFPKPSFHSLQSWMQLHKWNVNAVIYTVFS